jgi:hypothetical protein
MLCNVHDFLLSTCKVHMLQMVFLVNFGIPRFHVVILLSIQRNLPLFGYDERNLHFCSF